VSVTALKLQAFARPARRLELVVDAEAQDDAGGHVADVRQVDLFPDSLPQIELFHDAPLVPVEPEFMRAVSGEAESEGESCDGDSDLSHRNRRDAAGRNDRDQQDRNLRSVLDQSFRPSAKASSFAEASADASGGRSAAAADEAPIDDIGTNEFTEICGDALWQAFGRLSAPVKRIAQVANVNERTAKNWYEKKCAPGPIHTLRLMAHVPEFQGEMRRLAGMERDLDPDFARTMSEMVRLAQRMGLNGTGSAR